MGIHVNPWLIHVSVWQKPLQYCKVISLQLIKINEKKISMLLRSIKKCLGCLYALFYLIKKKIYEECVIRFPFYRWGSWDIEALVKLLISEREDFSW